MRRTPRAVLLVLAASTALGIFAVAYLLVLHGGRVTPAQVASASSVADERAYASGYSAGNASGNIAGRSSAAASASASYEYALATATISAYNAGAEAAYPSGLADGHSAGYSEGLEDGRTSRAAERLPADQASAPTVSDEERVADYGLALQCLLITNQPWNCD